MSPALAGDFSSEPSGKPQHNLPDHAVGDLRSHQSTGFNDLLLSRCTVKPYSSLGLRSDATTSSEPP